MAVFAPSDLKKLREAQHMSAADLAELVNCDTSTIHRYEAGKLKPNPDVMYQICEALGDIDKWSVWMRTEYPISYGRVHPEPKDYTLQGALMSLYAEIGDIMGLQQDILKDGADGKLDDRALERKLCQEITELLQSAQRVRSVLHMTHICRD